MNVESLVDAGPMAQRPCPTRYAPLLYYATDTGDLLMRRGDTWLRVGLPERPPPPQEPRYCGYCGQPLMEVCDADERPLGMRVCRPCEMRWRWDGETWQEARI